MTGALAILLAIGLCVSVAIEARLALPVLGAVAGALALRIDWERPC